MNSDNKNPEKKKKLTKPKNRTKPRKKLNKSLTYIHPSSKAENENVTKNNQTIEEEIEKDITKMKLNLTEKEPSLSENNLLNISNKKYTYEYLKQFENLEKAKETDLLPEDVLEHINQIEDTLSSMKMDSLLKREITGENSGSNCNTSKSSRSSFSNIMSLETWGRQDYTKETEEAENNKKIFEELSKKDIIKKELRELLNIMTKDNFEEIKSKILEIIKENIENQEKFLDIIFLKSLLEKSYVAIYAKLIKELNKELPQKIKKKLIGKKKSKKQHTIFREKLLEKCKKMIKFEERENFDDYINTGENSEEKENKIKKIILGNALFISELINNKMLSKRAGCDCIEYLFNKYTEGKNYKYKLINIQAIIIFLDKLGSLIQAEENIEQNKTKNENLTIKEKIKETFDKLDTIKNDESIPGHIRYSIINLIEKKENNYKQSSFEKYIVAKSKEEIKEEKPEKEEKKEKELTQEDINKLIEKDLYNYKEIIEVEGTSEKFSWNITTDLYDLKLKGFDTILEGYFISSADFIEKKGNLSYAKDYIKELVEYYHDKMTEEEKRDLVNKIIDLFELVKDFSFETPDIYCIYEYVLRLFIENEIIRGKELEKIFEAKKECKDDLNIFNKMFLNISENVIDTVYLKEFKEINFLKKQTYL